jgi:hypothetical protein
MTDMTTSKTILAQLGGGRFIAMTGAKSFVGGDKTLTFRVSGNLTKNRINCVRITLTPMDEYRVEGLKITGVKVKTVAVREGVHCDILRSIFTDMTGLYTSFGG